MNDVRTLHHPEHLFETLDPAALSSAERAEIQRQGAKAAARGEPADANPMKMQHGRTPASDESAHAWRQRSVAWEQGHAAQTSARRRG